MPAWSGVALAAPKPPFTFLREDPSGTQPKLFARDAGGILWNVKFGYEVHNESFCWRVVRACGYFAEPIFFVPSGRFEHYQPIRRVTPSLDADGSFHDARFQYRDPEAGFSRAATGAGTPSAGGHEGIERTENSDHAVFQLGQQGWPGGRGRPEHGHLRGTGPADLRLHRLGVRHGPLGLGGGLRQQRNCADFTAQTPEVREGSWRAAGWNSGGKAPSTRASARAFRRHTRRG